MGREVARAACFEWPQPAGGHDKHPGHGEGMEDLLKAFAIRLPPNDIEVEVKQGDLRRSKIIGERPSHLAAQDGGDDARQAGAVREKGPEAFTGAARYVDQA